MLGPTYVSSQPADTLTPVQQAALNALAAGSTFQDAAAAAGVNRTTLYRWTRSNPAFRAAYGEMEQVTQEGCRHDLVATAAASVDGVVRRMKEDVKFALNVIKNLGWLSPVVCSLPIEVGHVCQEIEVETKEREFQLRQRLAQVAGPRASRLSELSQEHSPAGITADTPTPAAQTPEGNTGVRPQKVDVPKVPKPQTRSAASSTSPAQAPNQSDATRKTAPAAAAAGQSTPHGTWTLEDAKALVALEKNPDGEGKNLLSTYMAQVSALAAHGAVTPQRH